MPTTLNSGLQLPDKGSVDWYSSMQTNYNLLDNHLENTDTHVTAEDRANWNSKQGSLSQAQLDAIAQVSTNTSDIATLQSGKANASHTHSSSDITDIGNYATKQYVDNSISGLVDNAPAALDTLKELSTALNDDANFATTVTNALSAKANSADLATVATSGDYDDLTDLPTYGITRLCSSAITDNSTVAFSAISSTDKIKAGDFLLDTNGKMYQISAVDTANETVSVTTPLTVLALDANVMHLSGDEDVNGIKTFKDIIQIDGDYLGNEASINQRTNICLRANRDTADKSCAFITRFRQNRAQGALQPLDLQKIGFDVLENEVRTNNVFDIQVTGWSGNVPTQVNFISDVPDYSFGKTSEPCKINNLNPSSLGMPDLSNGVDISGYITVPNTHNTYTPLVNGWISVVLKSTTGALALFMYQGDLSSANYSATSLPNESEPCVMCCLPVVGNMPVSIDVKGSNAYVISAKFYPCLGNV